MADTFSRKQLSIPGLLSVARRCFAAIPDTSGCEIPLVDHLMSGLALFGLKYPSLLQFDKDQRKGTVHSNLLSLYGIKRAPCDTHFRERLDEVDSHQLRILYKSLFSVLQRGKVLEGFSYLDGHYLLSLDGTGYFSSPTIHCAQCCEKHHKNGTITYYHQMLGAVLVHPDHKEVFPLAPEPILKQDGAKISLSGYAQSNARVSTLMRNIEASPWLEKPQLLEIKAVVVDKRRLNEFSMIASLKRTAVEQGGPKK